MNHFRIPLWRSAVVLLGLASIGPTPSFAQRSAQFEAPRSSVRPASGPDLRPVADSAPHTFGRPWRYTFASDPLGQVSHQGHCPGCLSAEAFPQRDGRERFEDHASEIHHPSAGPTGRLIDRLGRGDLNCRSLGAREPQSTDALSSTGLFEAVDSFCRSLLRML